MLAIVVKFFVLSECVCVCVLFFFSMGNVPEINGDDDDDDDNHISFELLSLCLSPFICSSFLTLFTATVHIDTACI